MIVGFSKTAILSVYGGYCFGYFRDKASVIIQNMQLLVSFSVVPICITLNDPNTYFMLNSGWLFGVKFFVHACIFARYLCVC